MLKSGDVISNVVTIVNKYILKSLRIRVGKISLEEKDSVTVWCWTSARLTIRIIMQL